MAAIGKMMMFGVQKHINLLEVRPNPAFKQDAAQARRPLTLR
jgi:hypothetical protein